MESQNLHTASLYINNLLLSRGLLRNGKAIDFAKPDHGEGGTDGTMSRVINLVHDMVLRGDREATQRENFAEAIRTLRSAETRTNIEISRLQTRLEDSQRNLSIAQGQERAFRATLRTAETANRGLREEMLRLKTMLQQVRTQCANDIRKRDVQIQRLKSHISNQQRGTRPATTTSAITITPSIVNGSRTHDQRGELHGGIGLDSPEYSLKQETTEFLTTLSQGLSDENDNLIGLLRTTLDTLRELQGLPAIAQQHGEEEAGIIGQCDDTSSNLLLALPTSYETLASEMHDLLEHLRTLLTNPSFVPIDEVEVREEEILRLREGWEKMEGRWREAVQMMDHWRKKIARNGSSINLEELKVGLGLGMGFSASVAGAPPFQGESKDEQKMELGDGHEMESDDQLDVNFDSEEDAPMPEPDHATLDDLYEDPSADDEPALGTGLLPDGNVLAEIHANSKPDRLHGNNFSAIAEESPSREEQGEEEEGDDEVALLQISDVKSKQDSLKAQKGRKAIDSRIPRQNQPQNPSFTSTSQNRSRSNKRVSPASSRSIEKKLNAAKREAEAAETARSKRRAESAAASQARKARIGTGVSKSRAAPTSAATKRKNRRRSTLSAQELETLMKAG